MGRESRFAAGIVGAATGVAPDLMVFEQDTGAGTRRRVLLLSHAEAVSLLGSLWRALDAYPRAVQGWPDNDPGCGEPPPAVSSGAASWALAQAILAARPQGHGA